MDALIQWYNDIFNIAPNASLAILWWLPMLAGAALGGLKHAAVDVPAARRQRTLAAEKTRMSPWTGVMGQVGPQPDLFKSAFSGGIAGLKLGQGLDQPTDGSLGESLGTTAAIKAQPGFSYAGVGGGAPSLYGRGGESFYNSFLSPKSYAPSASLMGGRRYGLA